MRVSVIFFFIAIIATTNSRSLIEEDEDSVVSIYTTVPTTTKTTKHLDVYQQIATNIAERITSPIYRFLGLGKNKTEPNNNNQRRKWETIELLDEEPNEVMYKTNKELMNNKIDGRDTEELSIETLKKDSKKPEKITLYSSYLPEKEKIEQQNKTINDIDSKFDDDDEPFEFDDIEKDGDDNPRQNGFIYFLELIASIAQLAWGALVSVFSSRSSS